MTRIYHGRRLETPEIIQEGTINGYDYLILSMGTHPCSYIILPEGHPYHGKKYDDIPLECHGGLTYSNKKILDRDNGEWVIGWDYAHLGDHLAYKEMPEGIFAGKKWTHEELQDEMEKAVENLKEITHEAEN